MKNPRINRILGYIVMFAGFFTVLIGSHAGTAPDGVNGYNYFVFGAGLILVIASFVWMILKVRCPHCNRLLHLKLRRIDVCPYCGKRTDINR